MRRQCRHPDRDCVAFNRVSILCITATRATFSFLSLPCNAIVIADEAIPTRERMIGNRKGSTASPARPAPVDAMFEYHQMLIEHRNDNLVARVELSSHLIRRASLSNSLTHPSLSGDAGIVSWPGVRFLR
jgi:hypothetical protein